MARGLLPCPLCGGEASTKAAQQREDGTYYPASCGCRKCGIWQHGDRDYGHGGFATEEDRERSMEQAVARWNRRAGDAPTLGDLYGILGDEKAVSDPDGGSNVAYIVSESAREQPDSCDHFTDAGKKAGDGTDSREKLLEDANALAIDYWGRRRTWWDAKALKKDVIALLDRQAAITEVECIDRWNMKEAVRIAEQNEQIAEMQAKLDEYENRAEAFTLLTNGTVYTGSKQLVARIAELQKQVDRFTARMPRECVDCELGYWAEVDELIAERDNLASDLEACKREREEYRSLCGKMLGVAQELRVVIDAWEGME